MNRDMILAPVWHNFESIRSLFKCFSSFFERELKERKIWEI